MYGSVNSWVAAAITARESAFLPALKLAKAAALASSW
jgi:hypothetical protein